MTGMPSWLRLGNLQNSGKNCKAATQRNGDIGKMSCFGPFPLVAEGILRVPCLVTTDWPLGYLEVVLTHLDCFHRHACIHFGCFGLLQTRATSGDHEIVRAHCKWKCQKAVQHTSKIICGHGPSSVVWSHMRSTLNQRLFTGPHTW